MVHRLRSLLVLRGDGLAIVLIELLYFRPFEFGCVSHGSALFGRHFLLHVGDFLVVEEFDD